MSKDSPVQPLFRLALLTNLSDSREFLIEAWKNANELHDLTKTDKEQSNGFTSHQVFSDWVYKARDSAKKSGSALRSNMLLVIVQFVRWMWNFEMLLQELVEDNHGSIDEIVQVKTIDTSALWRLAYLNVKVCSLWSSCRVSTAADASLAFRGFSFQTHKNPSMDE